MEIYSANINIVGNNAMDDKTIQEFGPWLWLAGSLLVVAALAGSAGLRRAIWHARVPVAFAVLACVALAGPEQTRYLIAGIDIPYGVVALLLAVLLTGAGAWFWARWSLNLAWQADLPGAVQVSASFWWRQLPRIAAVAPAAAALICWIFSFPLMPLITWIPLGVLLAAVAGGLFWLATARRTILGRQPAHARSRTWFLADEALALRTPATPKGLGEWLDLARACMPFDLRVLVPLFAGFLVLIFAVQAGATWPSRAAQIVGAAPTALIGLGALLTLLAPAIGLVAAAWRWPSMFFLVILIVGAAGANLNTLVREAPQAAPTRPELKAAATAWLLNCAKREENGTIRAIVVANAGGASRAALWTASVMRALETSLPDMQPGRHLFAISGISGGALGAAAYVATLDQSGVACGQHQEDGPRRARLDGLLAGLGQDFLAPPLAGLFLGDAVWRSFGPLSAAVGLAWWPSDRSVRLEHAWEAAFPLDNQRRGLAAPVAARSLAGGTPRLPLLFTGGTHLESGRLAVTAPVDVRKALPEVIDVIATLDGADLPFSVAASNSARFPYVTAPGLLRHGSGEGTRYFGQLVDGGYYDNHGSVAARAAVEALAQAHGESQELAGTRLHIFVVQVLSDPDLRRDQLPRCTEGRAGQQPEVAPSRAEEGRPSPLDFVVSPVGALVSVRGERANGGALEMARRYCGGDNSDFAVFSLGMDGEGIKPPLSWVLNRATRNSITEPGLRGFDGGTTGQGNGPELDRLIQAWTRAAR